MIKLILITLLTIPFFNASAYDDHLTYYDLFEYERDRQFEKDMKQIEKEIKKQNLKWERERDLESEKIHRRWNKVLQLNDDYDD